MIRCQVGQLASVTTFFTSASRCPDVVALRGAGRSCGRHRGARLPARQRHLLRSSAARLTVCVSSGSQFVVLLNRRLRPREGPGPPFLCRLGADEMHRHVSRRRAGGERLGSARGPSVVGPGEGKLTYAVEARRLSSPPRDSAPPCYSAGIAPLPSARRAVERQRDERAKDRGANPRLVATGRRARAVGAFGSTVAAN